MRGGLLTNLDSSLAPKAVAPRASFSDVTTTDVTIYVSFAASEDVVLAVQLRHLALFFTYLPKSNRRDFSAARKKGPSLLVCFAVH